MPTAPEPAIRIESRDHLAELLAEAAEIEHGLMCCYLYAGFSLGEPTRRGLFHDHAARFYGLTPA